MNASVMNCNFNGHAGFDKGEKHMDMIRTGRYKNCGQLEDQANGMADVETFVFSNGHIVPEGQAENSAAPVIKTAPEPNFGQLEDQANGMADVEEFVFRNGEVVPANQAQNSGTPVINTASEKNYGQLEDAPSPSSSDNVDADVLAEEFVFTDCRIVPINETAEHKGIIRTPRCPGDPFLFFNNNTETDK